MFASKAPAIVCTSIIGRQHTGQLMDAGLILARFMSGHNGKTQIAVLNYLALLLMSAEFTQYFQQVVSYRLRLPLLEAQHNTACLIKPPVFSALLPIRMIIIQVPDDIQQPLLIVIGHITWATTGKRPQYLFYIQLIIISFSLFLIFQQFPQ